MSFPDDPAPLEGPGTVIGRYRILEQIGEGGFGAVYVAEQREPVKRRVALKVIKLGMDTKQVVARFEAERQALAMMDHPNIAKVLDAGATETGRPYFVMELVRGIPITAYCDENSLDTQQRLGLFIQVCQAVQHAHQKGIIHRDLKPSNILVTLHDGVPVPMVIDFGIAKAMHGELTDKTVYTQFQQFIGTPAYVSPEQAEMSALDIDTRADIYSLGVLLYELLTGRVPFEAKELLEAGVDEMRRILREREPARPSTRLGKMTAEELTTTAKRRGAAAPKLISVLRGDLDWVVMKCLEKDRTRRYESASNLANDIQHHLASEPVIARPPSKAYRFQKAWRRNQLTFTAGAMVVVALVIGVGVSTWQAVVASNARNAEKQQRLAVQTERDKALRAQGEAQHAREAESSLRREVESQLYAARMNLVQQAWAEDDIPQVRELLDETQDYPNRGFEWYYWQQQTHLALNTLRGHLGIVSLSAFSADGHRIVTGSGDRTARVWDAVSGKELLTIKLSSRLSFNNVPTCLGFSPDGRQVFVADGSGTAKLWNSFDGNELLSLMAYPSVVSSCAYSPDGKRIATGYADGTTRVWDASSGKELLTFKPAGRSIISVAFSPDGKRILTASAGVKPTVRVFENEQCRELFTIEGHKTAVRCLVFSVDCQRILTSSADAEAKVWDGTDGRLLVTLGGLGSSVRSGAFSPDRRWVAAGVRNTAKIWDATDGRELLTLKGLGDDVCSVAFSPDGGRLVTGAFNGDAKVWDLATARDVINLQELSPKGKSHYDPTSDRMLTVTAEAEVKVWDIAPKRELLTLRGIHADGPALSPDGRWLLEWKSLDSQAYDVRVWEVASGRELAPFRGGYAEPVPFSPDGRQVFIPGEEGTAQVRDLAKGTNLITLRGQSNHFQWAGAFSPDGQRIASSSDDKTCRVWDAATGKEVITLTGHNGPVRCLAFSPDGKKIVTASEDATVKVWDVATGQNLLTIKGLEAGGASRLAFTPDGQRIFTGGFHGAKVWDAASGRQLLSLTRRISPNCTAWGLSSDGRRIVTAGEPPEEIQFWQAAHPDQVSAWKKEEQDSPQRLASLRQKYAAEVRTEWEAYKTSMLKRWLLLAPIPLNSNQPGAERQVNNQISEEQALRPRAGEAVSIGGHDMKWHEVHSDFFDALVAKDMEHSLAYAACYLRSETQQRGLRLRVAWPEQATVYLNGNEILKSSLPGNSVSEDGATREVTLDAGVNVLVVKFVTGGADEYYPTYVWLADSNGSPPKGVHMVLDPDGKEEPEAKKP